MPRRPLFTAAALAVGFGLAAASAQAQIVPPRTLDELKAETQARADRNAYPLIGLKPDEVREALARLTSLERDKWAAAWSAIGDRYMVRAQAAAPADADQDYLAAWHYYSFARWPVPNSPGKQQAYDKAWNAVLQFDRNFNAVGYARIDQEVRRLLITASGGPFRTKSLEEMRAVTVEQALNHPTWRMGPKITLDSATLMNKGLEVIEAHWLFGLPFEQIEVVVHPQSVIHSMVEFVDDSIKMQASLPSMHLPIQDALSYPDRLDRSDTALAHPLRWPEVARLDFEPVDMERFPCLRLAYEAGRVGGTAPAVLVGADETAAQLFLEGRIGFPQIAEAIEETLARHTVIAEPSLEETLAASRWAQEEVIRVTGVTVQ